MAVSTQSANLVWQKVKNYLSAQNVSTLGANPVSQAAFQGLRMYLSQAKKNFDLQFVPIDGVYSSSDGGNNSSQILIAGALTLYGVYLYKKGSTETIFKGTNHASTATTDGTQDIAIACTTTGDVFEIYPQGRALATGLTVTENTARTTSTLTLAANQMSGFVVIGA